LLPKPEGTLFIFCQVMAATNTHTLFILPTRYLSHGMMGQNLN